MEGMKALFFEEYDAFREKKLYGKSFPGIARTIFLMEMDL
jgi:hypothetical protein